MEGKLYGRQGRTGLPRGERTWIVRVFMGRDPESGKRKYTNKTIHATLRDAQSYLSRTQRDRDLGVFFEPSRMSFDGYLDLKVPLHQIRPFSGFPLRLQRRGIR